MLVAQPPVEIERTSKVYKRAIYKGRAMRDAGVVMVIASIWMSFYVFGFWQYILLVAEVLGVLQFVVGLVRMKWGERMAWWNN